jgi:hypothetical protein
MAEISYVILKFKADELDEELSVAIPKNLVLYSEKQIFL